MSHCDAEKSAEAETVERVGHLVNAAGATLKEKRRPIKVVARDGTVKKTIPHVEVIEGLLHHEGISGELQAGIRPKTILCAVCKCVVKVSGGTLPKMCKKHRGKKLCPRGCGAVVSKRSECCRGCRTPEERMAVARKANAALTPEKRSECGRKMASALTKKQRSEASRAWQSKLTAEQRSEIAKRRLASLTPAERRANSRAAIQIMNARTSAERSASAKNWRDRSKAAKESK